MPVCTKNNYPFVCPTVFLNNRTYKSFLYGKTKYEDIKAPKASDQPSMESGTVKITRSSLLTFLIFGNLATF